MEKLIRSHRPASAPPAEIGHSYCSADSSGESGMSLSPLLTGKILPKRIGYFCRALGLALLSFLMVSELKAQIAVTVTGATNTTPALSATYANFTSFVTALNGVTAVSGPVTATLAAGASETAPIKGFNISTSTANVFTTTNTLTIIKAAGAATVLNAGVGTAASAGASSDGIMYLSGMDGVTIDGLTFTDGNTASATVAMEFGIALFKRSAGDGCNGNTIQNCTFNMQRINNAGGTAPMGDGSTAIIVMNSTPAANTTALTPTNGGTLATNGTNSNNKFYTNTINGGNAGIYLSGFAATLGVGPAPSASTFLGDLNNDIGGTAAGTGNTVLNYGGGAATNPAVGIRANNQWSVNIRFNTIDNNNGSGVNHATTLRGIFAQAGTSANATISNNTVTVRSGATTSGLTAIDNGIGSTAATNTVDINNNTIRFSYTTATTGVFNAVSNSSTAAAVNINNNNIQQLAATNYTSTGTIAVIVGGSPGGTLSISNNTISNFNMTGASGNLRVITATTPTGLYTCTGNTIENLRYSTAGSTGSIIGIYNLLSATAQNWNNNIIRNFSTPGTGTLNGIQNNTVAGTFQCNNNQIYNFTTSAGGAGGFTANGITWSNANVTISGNLIYSINSTGSTGGTGGTITGINFSGAANVFNNAVYDLSSNSTNVTVTGINVNATGTNNVYNNLVGDLRAPNSTGNVSISGITAAGGTTNNIFHNTVNIAATTSSASTFGTSAIYFSSAIPVNNVRNNIFVNTSASGPTGGFAAAIRYTTAPTTTNFPATNSNNLYFAGTPSASKLIYAEGGLATATNPKQTIAAYKTYINTTLPAAGREASSVSENPGFTQTAGSNPVNNFLKYNTSTALQLEQGGGTGTGIASDFAGTTRCPGGGCPGSATTPDMGAWELNGSAADFIGPAITYTVLGNTLCTSNRTLSVAITDPSGVNVTAGTAPRLYYKKSGDANTFVGNTSADNGWKFVESTTGSSPFSFTLNASLLQSAIVAGDVIQYFVVAQDNGVPSIGLNNGIFASAPSSVDLTSAAFPLTGTINSYTVGTAIPSSVTIGAAGTYTSITGASGLFAAINAGGLNANTVATIIDGTVSETGTVALNQISYGCTPNVTLTIKPQTTATLIGSVASGALIKLNGADNVIIDGSNSGGTDRSLTISNTATTAPCAIWNASLGLGAGATDNTFKNCIINTSSATIATAVAIALSSTGAILTTTADNDNITIQNNAINSSNLGVAGGGSASGPADNLIVTGNNFTGTSTAGTLYGIQLLQANNALISQNTISLSTSAATTPVAIVLGDGVVNSLVTKNQITQCVTTNTGGYGGRGITIASGSATSNLTISNNFVAGVNGSNWNSFGNSSSFGIGIGMSGNSSTLTTTCGGVNLYNNSVHMSGSMGGTASALTSALYVGSGASNLNIRNNIFSNAQTGTLTTQKNYAVYSAAAIGAFSTMNYNNYWVENSFNASSAILGFLSADQSTLAAFNTAFGGNANSVNVQPLFNSATDLHLGGNVNTSLNNVGQTIAGLTDDIDGNTRLSPPDIGADEFNLPTCAIPGSITLGSSTLSWSAPSLGTPVAYNYEIRTSGAGGSGATGLVTSGTVPGTSASISGLPLNVTYTAYVRADCGSGDRSLWAAGSPVFYGYCRPTSNCTLGDVIASVTLNTLSNTTGTTCTADGGVAGYSDFTSNPALTTTLLPSASYNVTVGANAYAQSIAVWIDYNDDFVFDNVTERVGATAAGSPVPINGTASFTITLGCTPPAGVHRMRIRSSDNSFVNGPSQTPCTNYSWGQTEDYLVTIQAPPACLSTGVLSSAVASSSSANLSWVMDCSNATAFDIQYGAPGFALGSGTILTNQSATITGSGPTATGAYTLTGLTEGQSYDVYIRANCGGTQSAWSALSNFTIPCSVTVPFASTSSFSTTGFTATWTAGTGATSYRLDVSTSATFASFVTGFNDLNVGNVLTYNVTGLTAGNTYYWRVRAVGICTSASSSSQTVFTSDPLAYSVSRTLGNAYNSIAPVVRGGDGTGLDVPGITQTSNNDDVLSSLISLTGTTFQFQGSAITGMKISTNGWLTFNTAETSSSLSNGFAGSTVRRAIAPYWDDTYHYGAYSGLYYKIDGTLGSGAKIIVEWYKYSYYLANGPELYYQVVLDETGNTIRINYGNTQSYNGTFNRRHTYSMGLVGGFVGSTPAAGQIMALQYENSTSFSHLRTGTIDQGANSLIQNPEPRSSYLFTPGTYSAPVPFDPVVTAPLYDNVSQAVPITPLASFPNNIAWNTVESPERSNYFTLRGATQSFEAPVCGIASGGPSNPKDVWFKFNAIEPNTQVRVYPSAGMTPVIEVLDASLNPLPDVQCNLGTVEGSTALTSTLTGLTPGDDYYIRVYNLKVGNTAQVTANVTAGVITSLTLVDGGSNYPTLNSSPNALIRVTGGGGSGAVISASNSGGVLSFSIVNGGSGYTSAPTITVDSPDWGYTGEFGIIVFSKPVNDQCTDASLLTEVDGAAKVNAVEITGASVTSSSTVLTVASTSSLGAIGSKWVLTGPLIPYNTVAEVASATTLTLSSAATGSGSSLTFIARKNSHAFVNTGAATASERASCFLFTTDFDDDVFYKFVATSVEHTVLVTGRGGFDPAIDIRTGCLITDAALQCQNNTTGANTSELMNLTGLTIGTEYFIRVAHNGTGSPIGSSFDITVYKPLSLQYQFAQSSGTYSAVTGGTQLASGTIDNAVYKVVAGANKFRFNTVNYDSVFVSSNGFVMIDERPAVTTYFPLGVSGGTGALAAFAADLTDAAGAAEIRYEFVSPEHVFQWTGMRRKSSTGETISFQIRMNSTTGDVKYIYGPSTAGSGTNVTVCGIRNDQFSNPTQTAPLGGFKAINVMNRTTLGSPTAQTWSQTTTGTTVTSAVGTTSSSFPVSGLTFQYTASSCNPYSLVAATILTTDKADTLQVKWRRVPGSQGYVLRYRESTQDNLSYTSITVGSVDTDTAYTFAANTFLGSKYYLWDVLSVCGPSASQKSHASNTGIFNTLGDPIAYDYGLSSGTYSEITGGTVLTFTSGDEDDGWAASTPTGPVEINGAEFNEVSLNSNGFLVGGSLTLSAATYTPLASLLGLGLVSPFAEDLDGGVTGEIRYEDVGSEHVWQWKNWAFWSTGGVLNFQARYNKTSKVWKFVYGTNTFAGSSDSAYVGIRGGSNRGRRDILALSNRIPTFAASTVDWTKMHTANRGTANSGGASWPNTTVSLPSGTTLTFTPITCGGVPMANMPVTTTLAGEAATVITKNSASNVKWLRAVNLNSSAASNGYRIRYRDLDDPESVSTWASPANTGLSANDTTYNFTGLKPGATILYQVAARCDATNRTVFGGIGRFVTLPADFDIEFTSVVGPLNTSCFSSATPITLRITNNGLLAVPSGSVLNYTLNITGTTPQTVTGAFTTTASIAPGATLDFAASTANMSSAGSYTIAGNITWSSDEKANNNDLVTPYSVTSYPIGTAPATYSADAAQAGAGFSALVGTSLPEYRTSAMTNPTLAIQEGSGFVYWNSFNITGGSVGRFVTPCVTIPTNCFEMKFFHSRDNGESSVAADEGTVVRVSTDGGLSWTAPLALKNLSTGKDTSYVRRYYAPAATAVWQEFSLNLGDYVGQNIKVAFDMTSRFGNNFGIDNIRIANKLITNDLSYESVVSPESFASCGTSAVPVVVRVRNNGCQSYSDIGINLTVTGAGSENLSNVIPGPLNGGQFIDFTIGNVNMTNPGNYILDGSISVADQVSANNDLPNATIALIAPPQLSVSLSNANALIPATSTLNGTAVVGAPTIAYANNTNTNIADGSGSCASPVAGTTAVSNIVVGATVAASSLQKVTINITHSFNSDIRVFLRAPDGSEIRLIQSCLTSGADFSGTSFVASGGAAITTGSAPYNGNFAPNQAFSGLTGSATGTWQLRVRDIYSGDVGVINNWSIQFANQLSTASWTCASCPSGFPQSFTAPISSVTPSPNVLGSGWTAGSYNITLSANDLLGCANTRDTTFNLFSTNIWTGINDGANNWSDPANWIATPAPPDGTQEITIPAGTPFPPKANSSVTVGTVNQNSGSDIQIGAGGQLNIAANWKGNGGSTSGAGTVNFNGSGAQAITGTTDFNNLTVTKTAGSMTVSGTARINGTLTMANATSGIIVPPTGNLVIASTASGTGRIGVVPAGASITGNVKVERWLPWSSGGAAGQWYMLSSPITGKNFTDWSDDFKVYGPGAPSYGNQGGGIIAIGPQHSTILGFSEPLYADSANEAEKNGWKAQVGTVTNPLNQIINGSGYRVFVDKYTNISHLADNVGAVKTGIANFPPLTRTTAPCNPSTFNCDPTRSGWNLLGNPYPSPIDWDAATGWTRPAGLQGGSSSPVFWRYLSEFNSYGFYVPLIGWTGAGSPTNPNVIPSSQAFFVRLATGASASMSATENIKTGSANSFLRSAASPVNVLKMILKKQDDNSGYQYSGAVRFMDDATDGYDPMFDISNLGASGYYFTFPVDGAECGINSMGSLSEQKIVPLNTRFAGQSGNYTFTFEQLSSFNAGVEIFLKDKYFNTIQSLSGNPEIAFEVNSSTMTMVDRFELIFNPVPFTSVKGLGKGQFFGIHPNPSSGSSRVVFAVSGVNDNEGVITVVDMLGKVVFSSRMDLISSKLNEKEADLNLPAGVYNVKFSSRHSSFMEKLVIR